MVGGSSPGALHPVGSPADAKPSFETTIDVSGAPKYVAVRALNSDGKTLATSGALNSSTGKP